MTSVIIPNAITLEDEVRWNKLLLNSLYPSYIRSMSFGYGQKFNEREINTYIFIQDNEDIAGANYSIKSSPGNFLTTADILHGFVFKKEPAKELLNFLVEHYLRWAKCKKVSYVRLTPWLPKTIAGVETKYVKLFDNILKSLEFENIKNGRNTYWIDLSLSDEQLLNKMNPQTRRKIRKGFKSEIVVEKYDNPGNREFEIFWSLYLKLGENKGFVTLDKTRFKYEIFSLIKSGLARMYFLRYREKVVNVALASNFGVATYYHGALDPDYKSLEGCPSPGHLTQWEIIKDMKSKGLNIYDMAFCPGPVPIKEHPQFGIWQFKYGFGGDHVEFLPTYGKILKPISGRIFKLLKHPK